MKKFSTSLVIVAKSQGSYPYCFGRYAVNLMN